MVNLDIFTDDPKKKKRQTGINLDDIWVKEPVKTATEKPQTNIQPEVSPKPKTDISLPDGTNKVQITKEDIPQLSKYFGVEPTMRRNQETGQDEIILPVTQEQMDRWLKEKNAVYGSEPQTDEISVSAPRETTTGEFIANQTSPMIGAALNNPIVDLIGKAFGEDNLPLSISKVLGANQEVQDEIKQDVEDRRTLMDWNNNLRSPEVQEVITRRMSKSLVGIRDAFSQSLNTLFESAYGSALNEPKNTLAKNSTKFANGMFGLTMTPFNLALNIANIFPNGQEAVRAYFWQPEVMMLVSGAITNNLPIAPEYKELINNVALIGGLGAWNSMRKRGISPKDKLTPEQVEIYKKEAEKIYKEYDPEVQRILKQKTLDEAIADIDRKIENPNVTRDAGERFLEKRKELEQLKETNPNAKVDTEYNVVEDSYTQYIKRKAEEIKIQAEKERLQEEKRIADDETLKTNNEIINNPNSKPKDKKNAIAENEKILAERENELKSQTEKERLSLTKNEPTPLIKSENTPTPLLEPENAQAQIYDIRSKIDKLNEEYKNTDIATEKSRIESEIAGLEGQLRYWENKSANNKIDVVSETGMNKRPEPPKQEGIDFQGTIPKGDKNGEKTQEKVLNEGETTPSKPNLAYRVEKDVVDANGNVILKKGEVIEGDSNFHSLYGDKVKAELKKRGISEEAFNDAMAEGKVSTGFNFDGQYFRDTAEMNAYLRGKLGDNFSKAGNNTTQMGGLLKGADFISNPDNYKLIYKIAENTFRDLYKNKLPQFRDWAKNTLNNLGEIGKKFYNDLKPALEKIWKVLTTPYTITGSKALTENTLGLFGGSEFSKGFKRAERKGETFKGKYDDKMRYEIDDSKMEVKNLDYRKISDAEVLKDWRDKNIYDLSKVTIKGNKVYDAKGKFLTEYHPNSYYDSGFKNVQEKADFYAGKWVEYGKLDGLIKHDKLFKDYPELRNINVSVDMRNKGWEKGKASYDPNTNTIVLDDILFKIDNPKELKELKQIILHEIQHAIQSKEKFARGGLPEEFKGTKDENFDSYWNLAGEIEARDVMKRIDLTPEQRKQTPPYSSENIPRDKSLVFYDNAVSNSIRAKKPMSFGEFVTRNEDIPKNELLKEYDKYLGGRPFETGKKIPRNRIPMGERRGKTKFNPRGEVPETAQYKEEMIKNEQDKFNRDKRQRITDRQVERGAMNIVGKLTDKKILNIQKGDVKPVEEWVAIAEYVAKRTKDAYETGNLTDITYYDILRMNMTVSSLKAEAARTLGQGTRVVSKINANEMSFLEKIVNEKLIGEEQTRGMEYLEKAKKENLPNLWDKARYFIYNALLSRPVTQARNLIGNTANFMWEMGNVALYSPKSLLKLSPGNIIPILGKELKQIIDTGKGESKFSEGKSYQPKNKALRNSMPLTWMKLVDTSFRIPAKEVWKDVEARRLGKEFGESPDAIVRLMEDIINGKEVSEKKMIEFEKSFDAIERFADIVTFQQELKGINRKIQNLSAQYPFVTAIIPFVKTPINIVKAGLQPLKMLKFFSKDYRAKFNDLTSAQKKQELSKIATSTLMFASLTKLMLDGTIEVTGNGPEKMEERVMLERTGWKPNSIKIGNSYWSFQNLSPFNTFLGFLGNYMDDLKYNRKSKYDELNILEKASQTIAGWTETMTEQSYLQGLSTFFKWVKTKDPYYFEQLLMIPVPGTFTKDVQTYKDYLSGEEKVYNNKTWWEKFRNKIGFTGELKEKIDIFGDPRTRTYETLPIPYFEKEDKLARLLLDNDVSVGFAKKDQLKPNGERMTEDEYYEYQKQSGQLAKKTLLNNYETLRTKNPVEMNKEVDGVFTEARNVVYENLFGEKQTKEPYQREIRIEQGSGMRRINFNRGSSQKMKRIKFD